MKWIEVTDKMPEPRKDVLTIDMRRPKPYISIEYTDSEGEWFGDHYGPFSPTHWMPLPEFPELVN